MNETVFCWRSRLLTYGNTSYLFFPCQHMGDNPPKTNVATTPRTGRNKTPWTLTKLAPRQPPPSHNIITVISSLPYITTSTPLSPLSANDSLPSPPLDPSNLNPFFDFSHLRQLLISCAASRRPLPLLRGRPTPPKQCNIAIRTPRGWETTPSDTSPASFRNIARNVLGVQVPFVPDPDIEAHIAQSTTALVHSSRAGATRPSPGLLKMSRSPTRPTSSTCRSTPTCSPFSGQSDASSSPSWFKSFDKVLPDRRLPCGAIRTDYTPSIS